MTKFQNKYRIESHRRKGWDYGTNGLYFITICCKNRASFFGTVTDGNMNLTEIGIIAETYWLAIPDHFSNAILHNHIIMPNHMHGIIEIADHPKAESDAQAESEAEAEAEQTPNLGVSLDKPNLGVSTKTKNASEKWNPGILGVMINQYKRICTIKARKIHPDFGWHSNYHDIIIRDKQAYRNISNYIANNPKKWTEDTFNKK